VGNGETVRSILSRYFDARRLTNEETGDGMKSNGRERKQLAAKADEQNEKMQEIEVEDYEELEGVTIVTKGQVVEKTFWRSRSLRTSRRG
jgi:hypothetical protein